MKKLFLVSFLFLTTFYALFSQEDLHSTGTRENPFMIDSSTLPIIESLQPSRKNVIFAEYSKIIESNLMSLRSGNAPEYIFFAYKNTEKFTFQGLSARLCIAQETLATLNKIENAQDDIKNKTFILPVVDGLFVPVQKGLNSIEILLQENYSIQGMETLTNNIIYYKIDDRDFIFIPKKRFTPTERAYFLDSALRLPLENDSYWISSEFGKRKNPFSGQMKNHNGIDLAAPEGTPVYAIKDGAVFSCIENDSEFGNYIILSHDQGKLTSVYAHLQSVKVEQYQSVKKGDIIGFVGQTGLATGPHLHFEIRKGGKAEDPKKRLKLD